MKFTYEELDRYADIINTIQELVDEVKEGMRGAYPDNSSGADLDYVGSQARNLKIMADALSIEVTALETKGAKPAMDATVSYAQAIESILDNAEGHDAGFLTKKARYEATVENIAAYLDIPVFELDVHEMPGDEKLDDMIISITHNGLNPIWA